MEREGAVESERTLRVSTGTAALAAGGFELWLWLTEFGMRLVKMLRWDCSIWGLSLGDGHGRDVFVRGLVMSSLRFALYSLMETWWMSVDFRGRIQHVLERSIGSR